MTGSSLVPTPPTPPDGTLVDPAYLEQLTRVLRAAGQAANQVGAHHVFTSYRQRKSKIPCAARMRIYALLKPS